jgi:hypothetical protein
VLTLTISVAFNLRRQRTRILRLNGKRSYRGAKLWLEGLLGFEPRMVELTVTMGYVAYLRGVRAVPRLCYTLAFALQLRKITENLSQGIRNNGSGPASPLLGGSRSTLGQRKCLPSC